MAQKRSAKDAFGMPNNQLSAAAAARQARLLKDQAQQTESSGDLVESIAGVPYNGHHSGDASDEDDNAGSVPIVKKIVTPNIPFSTLNPTAAGALVDNDDDDFIEAFLRADQTAMFIGEYDVQVVKGVVNIHGAMIHPDLGPQRVHAFSTHALPSIAARTESHIRVTSVKSGLLKLAKLSPLFRNIGAAKSKRSFQFLASNASDPLDRPLLPLEIDEATKRIISRMNAKLDSSPHLTMLAVGPKSSGKSTFNRLLCNMTVSRPGLSRKCWYLDLDPGQPEFGPPGQLSLVEVSAPILGPPYTHPASSMSKSFRLARSHTIAATTFKDDAERYLLCAADLIAEAALTPQPMVINSCGWTSGLGATTLLSVVENLPSTPEIILLGESPDSELATCLSPNIAQHIIPRRVRVQGIRTPAEQRAMVSIAYFHQKSTQQEEVISWDPKPISKFRPWIYTYKPTAKFGLTGIVSCGQSPHPDFLAETLDGAIVVIVVLDPGMIDPSNILRTTTEDLPYIIQAHYPMPSASCRCLGLALIRGINVYDKSLQLITPIDLDAEALERGDLVLVRGSFDSPDWAYLEDLYAHSTGDEDKARERPWVALTGENVEHGKVWRVRRPPLVGAKG